MKQVIKSVSFGLTFKQEWIIIGNENYKYEAGIAYPRDFHKIIDVLEDPELYKSIKDSGFDLINNNKLIGDEVYSNIEPFSKDYLEKQKELGNIWLVAHKNVINEEISQYYDFEVHLNVCGKIFGPERFATFDNYPNKMILYLNKEEKFIEHVLIQDPMEPRCKVALVDIDKIDKIIGVKRNKSVESLNDDSESIVVSREEYLIKPNNCNPDDLKIFEEHSALTVVWEDYEANTKANSEDSESNDYDFLIGNAGG